MSAAMPASNSGFVQSECVCGSEGFRLGRDGDLFCLMGLDTSDASSVPEPVHHKNRRRRFRVTRLRRRAGQADWACQLQRGLDDVRYWPEHKHAQWHHGTHEQQVQPEDRNRAQGKGTGKGNVNRQSSLPARPAPWRLARHSGAKWLQIGRAPVAFSRERSRYDNRLAVKTIAALPPKTRLTSTRSANIPPSHEPSSEAAIADG